MMKRIFFLLIIFTIVTLGIYGVYRLLFLTEHESFKQAGTITPKVSALPALTPTGEGFNYASYEPTTYSEFGEFVSDQFIINKKQGLKGLSIFGKKVRINDVVLTEYPSKIGNDNRDSLEAAVGIIANGNQEELINLFGYSEVVSYKWGKINLFFQSGLVPHLRSEQVLGKKIILYGVLTHLNDFGNEANVLVNEFDAS